MQDAETLVALTLDADAGLIALLGGKDEEKGWNRIYNDNVVPDEEEYPRITLFEVVSTDAVPADNKFLMSDVNVRVDIWIKDKTTLFGITKRVKKILEANLPCRVRLGDKIFEKETEVYHKVVEVYLLLEQESEL